MVEINGSVLDSGNITKEEFGKPVPRMRTMQECVDYFKSKDPESKIKYCTLRRWVLEGKVPFAQIGNRKLINLDILIEMVEGTRAWPDQKNKITVITNRRKIV